MKVSATLKGTTDSIGRRTVYIRIVENGKRKFYATGIRVAPSNWKKKVVGAGAAALNDQIKSLILAYESGFEKPEVSFHAYAQKCLSDWEYTKKQSTLSQLTSKFKKFKDFFNGKLSTVTADLLQKYVSYCYSLGNQENTVWTSLKAIRVVINQAYKEGIIKENPFRSFAMPRYRDPHKIYLTKSQVESISDFAHTPGIGDEYRIAAGWFLISCYTGLRFGDQVAFNKSKIRDGRLVMYTSKTGQVVSIKINEKLKGLFKLVNNKPMPYTNEHYNRLLKAIATVCGIPEKVSVHTGRHTAAVLLAQAGVSIEVTAKILGHSSIRQTAIYYQITGDRIDKEMEKIF